MARTTAGLFAAATLLAAARACLMALKDPYLGAELWNLAARSGARHLLEGYALTLPLLAVVAFASRARRTPRAVPVVAALLACIAGYLFVSFRLPALPYYAPHFEGTKALAAHGGAGLVALVAAIAVTRGRPRWMTSPALALLAALLLALPAAGLRILGGSSNGDTRPNLLLISIDTLRADRLGCYGYDRPTSPEIDRFAQEALVFTNAFSPESWTLPAHMSMLTSLYPTSHGVAEERALPHEVPTLATELSDAGYATFGIVDDAYWIGPQFGFAKGFDSYRTMTGDGGMKIHALLGLIDDLDRRPFFAFLHLYDVHSDKRQLPYEADPEDVEAFAGWYQGSFTGCNERGECASEMLFKMVGRRETLGDEDARYVSSLYDAGIRTLDRKLGVLFEGLGQRGLLENTAVLVTADHGEEFFEHGRAVHTQYFDECVRVPFILRPPGGARREGQRSPALASLVDVMPTLLAFAELEPEVAQGVSLVPCLTEAEVPARGPVLIDGRQPLLGLRTPRWSIVPTEGRLAAFDTRTDAAQSADLFATDAVPDELAELRARLEEELERLRAAAESFGPGERRRTSNEDAEALKALGYGGD